jgi:hypothetical protein
MQELKVIETGDKLSLEKEVNIYLDKGWEVHGPLFVFEDFRTEDGVLHLKYIQSVIWDTEA